MSQVYSTEPPTTGRVILQTSHGPVDINLWCKECPTTTRLFLQLCVDGFYDGIIFHRILNDFLIQCGSDRENEIKSNSAVVDCSEGKIHKYMSAQKDACVSMDKKKLELSPRIRFNHRGQVALALPLDSDVGSDGAISSEFASLARQFFITLDEAPFLNTKHIIFGTVTGATIFNAMRIGKTDTTDSDSGMPADLDNPPTIKSIKIDFHPFNEIVQTRMEDVPWSKRGVEQSGANDVKKRRKKRKGKRDLNVLSFGGEMEDEDEGGLRIESGIHSSHDMLCKKGERKCANDKYQKKAGDKNSSKKRKKDEDLDVEIVADSMNKEIDPSALSVTSSHPNATIKSITLPSNTSSHYSSPSNVSTKKISKNMSSEIPPKKLSAIELRRSKYLARSKNISTLKKGSKQRDEITMTALGRFSSKMLQVKSAKDGKRGEEKNVSKFSQKDNSLATRMDRRDKLENVIDKSFDLTSAAYAGQVLEDVKNVEVDGSWLREKFKCKRYTDDKSEGALGGDGRNINDYDIVDERGRRRQYNSKHRPENRHNHDSKHRIHGRTK